MTPTEVSCRAVVGAAIMDPAVARRVLDALPTEVIDPTLQGIVDALEGMLAAAAPVDPTTVLASLIKARDDEAAHLLSELIFERCESVQVGWHIQHLAQEAVRLRLLGLSGNFAQVAAEDDPTDSLGVLRERFDRITDVTVDRPPSVLDLLDDYLTDLEQPDEGAGLPTGLHDLDEQLGGLRKGQLVVVGARPGRGKSVLLIDWCREVASRGETALLCSLEMPRKEVMGRIVAAEAKVDVTRLVRKTPDEADFARLSALYGKAAPAHLLVDDNPSHTLQSLAARARTVRPRLLAVDYLQLIQTKSRNSRQEEVSAIARDLKHLARDLDCTVLVAAQLNRGAEQRTDKRPRLSDLRESGEIEAAADVVVLLERDDTDETMGTTATLHADKVRSGRTGSVQVAFHGHTQTFTSLYGGAA